MVFLYHFTRSTAIQVNDVVMQPVAGGYEINIFFSRSSKNIIAAGMAGYRNYHALLFGFGITHYRAAGHFVVVQGYDYDRDHILVADPLPDTPLVDKHYYSVEISRLLAAIHLGILTYDANLLVIEKRDNSQP